MSKHQRIADLEQEVAELRQFNETNRERAAEFESILTAITALHQPFAAMRFGGARIELRCNRCRTDEHHTRGPENHMLWPCPTLATFASWAEPARQEADR